MGSLDAATRAFTGRRKDAQDKETRRPIGATKLKQSCKVASLLGSREQKQSTMAAKGKKKPAAAPSSSEKGGGAGKKSKQQQEEPIVEEDSTDADDESSVYDSGDDGVYPDQQLGDDDDDDEYSSEEDDGDYESEEEDVDGESGSDDGEFDSEEEDGEGFEEQGSSDEDEIEVLKRQAKAVDRKSKDKEAGKNQGGSNNGNDDDDDDSDDDGLEVLDSEGLGKAYENVPRTWRSSSAAANTKRTAGGKSKKSSTSKDGPGEDENAVIKNDPATSQWMHTDDLSSDDEDADGTGNRIGRVPLHWYEDYDHIGYDAHGGKVIKQGGAGAGGDMLDEAIRQSDNRASGKFVVHDALNARDVELTPRQIELIRRIQSGELYSSFVVLRYAISFELVATIQSGQMLCAYFSIGLLVISHFHIFTTLS